jgi:oxygen-independent coproporphyrinogen-3 oxidase
MCHGTAGLDLTRFAEEWHQLLGLAVDGLVVLEQQGDLGLMRVTPAGRWLIRSIAAVFDPQQQRCATGSRLI